MTIPENVTETTAPDAPPAKTSGLAIASLVFSILIPLIGIILGIISLQNIKRSCGRLSGRGLAITGIIISSALLMIQCFILLPAFFWGQADKARIMTTKTTLVTLHHAVINFELDTGRFPHEEEGLFALVEQPYGVQGWSPTGYLEGGKIPRDAWGNEFVYLPNPKESGKPFVIISYGADGMEEGRGNNSDIYSTNLD